MTNACLFGPNNHYCIWNKMELIGMKLNYLELQ